MNEFTERQQMVVVMRHSKETTAQVGMNPCCLSASQSTRQCFFLDVEMETPPSGDSPWTDSEHQCIGSTVIESPLI